MKKEAQTVFFFLPLWNEPFDWPIINIFGTWGTSQHWSLLHQAPHIFPPFLYKNWPVFVALEAYVEGYKSSLSFRRRGTMFKDYTLSYWLFRSPTFCMMGGLRGINYGSILIGALALVENRYKPMHVYLFFTMKFFHLCQVLYKKMVTNDFGNRNFMQPMRRLSLHKVV